LLTLVIACFNFINLTIAKTTTVSREVGVKKVFGASREQLFSQFLLESVILCFVSSLFAVTIIQIIIPYFNQVAGSDLSLNDYLTFKNIFLFFVLIVLIGSIAGIYPAIKLSAFRPVHYLKKFDGNGKKRSAFKTGLVIFQYTVSIVLILSVFVVVRQISYMKDFKTGFKGENVIVLQTAGEVGQKREAFSNEIKAVPGVSELSFSSAAPGEINNYEGFSYMGLEGGLPVFTVDPSFFPMLDIKIREGRNFEWERPNDRHGVCILNSEAVRLWKIEDPVGKFLKHDYYLTTIPRSDIEIIGVLDDYHYLSPKDTIGPALFCYGDWYNTVSIKISGSDIKGTIKGIESVWNKFAPGFPFTYSFLNDNYELQYKTEATLSTVLVFFALIALVIACLGLLGLVSFLAQEKTKEIGIRKVFGATSGTIMKMLSASFLKWVIIAILAGTPVAIIIMKKWLMTFAFHTSISWWLVVLAGFVLLSISLSTIIFHIAKVSATNPINVLKYE